AQIRAEGARRALHQLRHGADAPRHRLGQARCPRQRRRPGTPALRLMKRMRFLLCALVAALLAPGAAEADDLVPTGTLRATFIAGNPVQAITDAKTGDVTGPAADLGRELARRLNVSFAIKGVPGVQPVIDSVKNGDAEIGFVA